MPDVVHPFFQEAHEPAGRRRGWVWMLVVAVAVAIYVATASPVLGVCWPCLRAGWSALRSGWWILNNDEEAPRRRICFVFHLATAGWKAAATAFGVIVLLGLLVDHGNGLERFWALMMVLMAGVAISTLLGLGAILAALRHKTRVWVHPRIDQSCAGDFRAISWLGPRPHETNHAIYVVFTSLAAPLLVAATALCMAVLADETPNDVGLVAGLLSLSTFIAGPIAAVVAYVWLSRRIIAPSPSDCWPCVSRSMRSQLVPYSF